MSFGWSKCVCYTLCGKLPRSLSRTSKLMSHKGLQLSGSRILKKVLFFVRKREEFDFKVNAEPFDTTFCLRGVPANIQDSSFNDISQ